MRKRNKGKKRSYVGLSVLSIVLFFFIWWLFTEGFLGTIKANVLPGPVKVFTTLIDKFSNKNPDGALMQMHLWASLKVTLSGYVIGCLVGIPLGIFMGWYEKADIFMVNQEFPFTVRGTAAEDKQFTFRVPESRIHILQEMGVDIVSLANNHILAFGPDGLLDSCEALDAAGILRVGGGKDFDEASQLKTMIVGQKTIGFLGTSRVYMDTSWAAGDSHPGVFSTYDPAQAIESIQEAKSQCDYLVVYVHWGVEREDEPKEYQKTMGRQYIDAGADLVVGSHPHVLQAVEYYNGKPIVYSLGNFVFGSSIPETMLVRVELGEGAGALSLVPAVSSAGFTRQMDAAKQEDFFRRMEEMSAGIQIEGGAVLPPNHSP